MKVVKTAAFQPIKIVLETEEDMRLMDAILVASRLLLDKPINESICNIPIGKVTGLIDYLRTQLENEVR